MPLWNILNHGDLKLDPMRETELKRTGSLTHPYLTQDEWAALVCLDTFWLLRDKAYIKRRGQPVIEPGFSIRTNWLKMVPRRVWGWLGRYGYVEHYDHDDSYPIVIRPSDHGIARLKRDYGKVRLRHIPLPDKGDGRDQEYIPIDLVKPGGLTKADVARLDALVPKDWNPPGASDPCPENYLGPPKPPPPPPKPAPRGKPKLKLHQGGKS